ncbi:hypothetical protein SAMN05444920_107320 [Nonomuraea solani]|uniref:Uncharacterized protein n=1 Tax=Nonomuraea solani TaxID=1144553 RepID=A0A1H6E260_9ACTN|nr:hypothetical protein [Nonomuraea solani]SEG91647.1 hypothetical protein SAMN05444920_107320 [Nonomuraea solani]
MFAKIAALTVAASLALAPAAATAATAATAETAARPNLRACYDGNCKLTITKAVSFRVSPRFGITRLRISFTGSTVSIRGTSARTMSQTVIGRNATGSVNGIGVRIISLSAGKAVLRLKPGR